MTQPKWILAEVVIMSNITKSHGNNLQPFVTVRFSESFKVRF